MTLAGMRLLMGIVWLSLLARQAAAALRAARTRRAHAHVRARAPSRRDGPLRGLVHRLVIPHFTLFAWIIFVLELLTGLLLVTGFYTRIGAWLGLDARAA